MCGCFGDDLHVWWFWPKQCNVNPFKGPATCGHFDQNSVAILLVILMCGRLAVLTKRAVAILVVAVLVAAGFVAILVVPILEWNRFY